jgi:hypothetical protein
MSRLSVVRACHDWWPGHPAMTIGRTSVIAIFVADSADSHRQRRVAMVAIVPGVARTFGGTRRVGCRVFDDAGLPRPLVAMAPRHVPATRGGMVARRMAGTDPRVRPGDFGTAMTVGRRMMVGRRPLLVAGTGPWVRPRVRPGHDHKERESGRWGRPSSGPMGQQAATL